MVFQVILDTQDKLVNLDCHILMLLWFFLYCLMFVYKNWLVSRCVDVTMRIGTRTRALNLTRIWPFPICLMYRTHGNPRGVWDRCTKTRCLHSGLMRWGICIIHWASKETYHFFRAITHCKNPKRNNRIIIGPRLAVILLTKHIWNKLCLQ